MRGIRGFVVCNIYSCNIRRCTVMYTVQNWSEGGQTPAQVEKLLIVYLIVELLCIKFLQSALTLDHSTELYSCV